ncbi:cysteine-rich venom protein-like [Eriocheir sinensis]|uniref:cysteine-rich venom protein-like n=1 Tax=Eriocheir sinensis TaxID=95602 RepID=UPI0021C8D43D|nr:cysteine-rich venom protein-like [Eriocheir sinensis]
MSHALAGNDVEFSRARSFWPERNFYEGSEEVEDEDEEEDEEGLDLNFEVPRIHDKTNEEEEEDEEDEEGLKHEEHDTNLMNMIETPPELVTMNPFTVDTKADDQEEEKQRQRRPHDSRKARRERRRRRRWKKRMKAAKKFYRGNRTFKWGTKKHQQKDSSGGSRPGQRQWSSPNRRSGWVSGQPYRSLDPRRVKVRRHLVRQHNLLRANVDPPAADMLAVKWYKTAAEQAQAWAEQCGHHSHPEHPSVRWTSNYGACGQNVFVSPAKKRWTQVLEHWWSGKKEFHYGGDNNSTAVAAYTQMAWYNSHQVGCGFSQCSAPGGSTFFRYVCNYCPVGNDPTRLDQPYSEGSACSLCPGACRSLCPRRSCPLCTNACTYSDLWVNCAALDQQWHEWLCNTKTANGVERFKNCRATCQCVNEIT